MLLSRKWLDEFVHVDANDKDFAEAMTLSGSKVETTEDRGAEISNIVVGTILTMERHPIPTTCGSASWMWARARPSRLSPAPGTSTPAIWCPWPWTTPPSPAARRSRRASCGAWSPTA